MRTNQKKSPFERIGREKKIFKNKGSLDLSYVPEFLPEREKEIEKLQWYLKDALEGNTPSNLFIYGYTGVGKTACCRKVLRDLHKKIIELKISGLRTMYLNCATTNSECKVIAKIANFFKKKQVAPRKGWALADYYQIFGDVLDDLGGIFIIVLDEVDKLVPENENVLYNLTRAKDHILLNANLSLIGISNDPKFYDYLDPRTKSSMCQRKIIINPYTAPQLEKILTQRAKVAFTKDALERSVIPLCAALAAQEHGDARKAIDLLRLAGELAEAGGGKHIREEDIRTAQKELEKSIVKEVIKGLPTQKKIALLAIAQSTGENGSTTTGKAYERYSTLAPQCGLRLVTLQRFSNILSELNMMGICDTRVLTRGRHGRTTKIQIALSLADVGFVLSEDEILAPLCTSTA